MQITIEVLPECAKPLYDKGHQMAVILKNGKPTNTNGIREKRAVLVPLSPIRLKTLRGIVETMEFSKKEGYGSCVIVFNPDKTAVGVVCM